MNNFDLSQPSWSNTFYYDEYDQDKFALAYRCKIQNQNQQRFVDKTTKTTKDNEPNYFLKAKTNTEETIPQPHRCNHAYASAHVDVNNEGIFLFNLILFFF
jgi:hypothetical protein